MAKLGLTTKVAHRFSCKGLVISSWASKAPFHSAFCQFDCCGSQFYCWVDLADPTLCSQFSLAFFLGEVEKGLEISILIVLISLLGHQHLIEFQIHLSEDRVSKVVFNGHVSSVVAIGSRSCTGGLHLDARVTRTGIE